MEFKLVWSDNFEVDGRPDPEKWQLETGGHGFGNNENQYYTDRLENAYVKDNRLVIEGRKESYNICEYTSAKLTTKGIKSMQYGKVVVSAKIPEGKGTWPAIWMLPESMHQHMKWPDCGEICIMENIGRDKDEIHFSLHTGIFNHLEQSHYTHHEQVEGASDRFIEYSIVWTPDYVEYLVDNKRIVMFHKWAEGKTGDFEGWPFDQPFYLILNLALGGNWGGEIDNSIFPVKFEIDSVKYYELVK